jgi:beta-glucosidase
MVAAPAGQEAVTATPLYRDPDATPAARAGDLVGRMSLDEKLAQLGCVWSTQLVEHDAFSEAKARALLAHGTGHVTRIGGSTGLRPRESAAFSNAIQRFLVERTRLGIPALVHEESCAGFTARDATQFPQAIGLAATFDPERVHAMARTIRAQMLAVGARQTLAPVLDVARDPRWGRTEETFGEDPYLVSRLGVAYVRGVQGEDLRRGVAATGKHFLAYGASEGGLNHAPAHVGPRELREVYARPFEAAIREAGLASVMNAYNEVDGLPCGGSPEILDSLLRGELGFEGVVVADYFAVRLLETFHRVAADRGEAARCALEAGIDVELPALDCYGAPLREQVEAGRVPLAQVDRAVRRALRLKFALGLFEAPFVDAARAAEPYDTPESIALARELACKSIVLLRNAGDLLPLDPAASPLALIGPAADDVRLLLGDYHYPAHLEIVYARGGDPGDIAPAPGSVAFRPGPYFRPMVSLLAGLRAALPAGTELRFARGCDVRGDSRAGFDEAVRAARGAAAAIVAVGGRSGLVPECTSGEFRDASQLGLTGVQEELVEAIVATGTPTVVVLVNGRPLALTRLAERVPALVEAWLPGEQGGHAVADVLFGRVDPGGRLPISLPRSVGQVPVYHGHKSGGGRSQMFGDYSDGPTRPLFAFGHGLSYTRFEYTELRVEPGTATAFDPVAIGVRVANVGPRAGDEVVQLYARDLVASVTRPVRQLVGFQRLHLAPGEARRVVFQLDPSQLACVGPRLRWRVEPGRFAVQVGASSEDVRAEGGFEVVGEVRELDSSEIVPTRTSLHAG